MLGEQPGIPEEYGSYLPAITAGKAANGTRIDDILNLETLVYKNASEKGITEDQAQT